MHLEFAKMHGLGNDFMVVDLVTRQYELQPEQIRLWGDRRTGIGFDQLLAVMPPADPTADFRYRIFNADGSEAEQCGNGARCFAKFVTDRKLTIKTCLTLETSGGLIHTELMDNDAVLVDMGMPETDPERIPFKTEERAISYSLRVGDETYEITPVSIGNPHAVMFVDDVAETKVAEIGASIQRSDRFPESVNVGFLQIIDQSFARLRVYERGAGETLACGTGACAAMVAGRLHGRFKDRAKISLPGGKIRIMWHGENSPVRMVGPAALVYEGRVHV
ncbi:MAG: diaminopimelate epimerase [Gammaproteobacteria bacterium]|nr:diaminopimelate epimerase [Gammaproteobacteria bacterium]